MSRMFRLANTCSMARALTYNIKRGVATLRAMPTPFCFFQYGLMTGGNMHESNTVDASCYSENFKSSYDSNNHTFLRSPSLSFSSSNSKNSAVASSSEVFSLSFSNSWHSRTWNFSSDSSLFLSLSETYMY